MAETQPIRLLNLGKITPGQTQSIYHVLAEQMQDHGQDAIVICQPAEPYLCLGYHQVFESIFDPVECQKRHLPVYRRQIGGGATYLDDHQIFYQCIFHHQHLPVMIRDIYAFALAAPVMALRRLGLNAELRDTNEIEVDGKRIAGTGGGRIGEAVVVVGNLLFDFDFNTMAAVWRTPTQDFRALAAKALRESMLNLKDAGVCLSMEETAALLIDCFADATGRQLEPGELSDQEMRAAQEKAEELRSPGFLALQNDHKIPEPMCSLKISARSSIYAEQFGWGDSPAQGSFWVKDGYIQETVFNPGSNQDWHKIEQELSGCPFNEWKERFRAVCGG